MVIGYVPFVLFLIWLMLSMRYKQCDYNIHRNIMKEKTKLKYEAMGGLPSQKIKKIEKYNPHRKGIYFWSGNLEFILIKEKFFQTFVFNPFIIKAHHKFKHIFKSSKCLIMCCNKY